MFSPVLQGVSELIQLRFREPAGATLRMRLRQMAAVVSNNAENVPDVECAIPSGGAAQNMT
ncbi:hypothetical protein D1871_22650 [Nakamurella silvestris]|nr:hypothetical protein D1871_22650 [Nakamurella silvestris]